MGYIPSPAGPTALTAFITQAGRTYLVTGQPADFRIRYFSLGDPDTSYLQASQTVGAGANVLPAGFVPDLSGDENHVTRSMAGGVVQRNFLYGGASVDHLGTAGLLGGAVSSVGFGTGADAATVATTVYRPGLVYPINVPVSVLSSGVLGGEQVRVSIAPPSRGTSAALYPHLGLNNGGIIGWNAGDAVVNNNLVMTLSLVQLPVATPAETVPGGYRFNIYLLVSPYKSSIQVPSQTAVRGIQLTLTL
jgi:hypothetical protein